MTTGYSGTPLWKKLGLKDAMTACVLNPPDGYHNWLAGSPAADWSGPMPGQTFTHLFTVHRAELEDVLPRTLAQMDRNGMIWVSWPKKASKVPTDITEDTIRAVCLPLGLVDVKVCAVTDIWSGLKLMIRKDQR